MQKGPEAQIPLFMLYMWFYAQVFGTGEWVLRAAALPWFAAGVAVFAAGVRHLLRSMFLPAALAIFAAFTWFYLNEAKVYSGQLGFALALTGSGAALLETLNAGKPSRGWWRLFLLSLWLLCGTSVLAMFFSFFFLLAYIAIVPSADWKSLLRLAPGSLVACIAGLFMWAGYYAWTMTFAGAPSAVGTTTPQTIVFIFYELLGFAGWGPGRNDLRASGVSALKPFLLPLMIFGVLLAAAIWLGLKEAWSRFGIRRVVVFILITVFPLAVLCAYGMATRFRVLGRHATPLLPLLLLLLALGLVRAAHSFRLWGKIFAGIFLLAWLGSSMLIRFEPRHKKDDYRDMVAMAKSAFASGKSVWWNADAESASYYGLPTNVVRVANPDTEYLQHLSPPDIAITCKPDTYDGRGNLHEYLQKHGYRSADQLSIFTIWKKPE